MWRWPARRSGGEEAEGGAPASDVPEWFGHEGIDLRVEAQLELLRDLEAPELQELFRRLRVDPRLRARAGTGGRGRRRSGGEGPAAGGTAGRDAADALVRNGYFPSPDAELYAAMIVRERPCRVIEVGSGYSTLVARHAIEASDVDCRLHVIDPEPRLEVGDVADSVERLRVEESRLAAAQGDVVEPGTLLFIDASHTATPGGDGPFLYCRLLPSLPPGVLVHVHDIYLPFDYPRVYVERGYAEQYLLHGLLAGNARFQVECAAYFLSRKEPEAMRRAFGEGVARGHTFEGASFWVRTVRGGVGEATVR